MLPAFAPDGALNVFIESPKGATAKWKYDNGVIRLQRPLPAGFAYPYDWGFVTGTRAADGDPLDAVVYWSGVSYPGVIIRARPIGVLRVEQANTITRARERNDRLVTVPVGDPTATIGDVFELPERVRREIEHFFATVVAFEDKDLVLHGWGTAADAMATVAQSVT